MKELEPLQRTERVAPCYCLVEWPEPECKRTRAHNLKTETALNCHKTYAAHAECVLRRVPHDNQVACVHCDVRCSCVPGREARRSRGTVPAEYEGDFRFEDARPINIAPHDWFGGSAGWRARHRRTEAATLPKARCVCRLDSRACPPPLFPSLSGPGTTHTLSRAVKPPRCANGTCTVHVPLKHGLNRAPRDPLRKDEQFVVSRHAETILHTKVCHDVFML